MQIHHIPEQYAALVDGMVVVVGEEVWDSMRIAEAAFFVKGHGEGAFAGAHQQNRMGLPVGVFDIGD